MTWLRGPDVCGKLSPTPAKHFASKQAVTTPSWRRFGGCADAKRIVAGARGRPCVEVILTLTAGGQQLARNLLADTGAGSRNSAFQLILEEDDCLLCGGN